MNYTPQDYAERCADIDLALTATRERIDEWDEHADPHGWWHERPSLIALVEGWAMADDLAAALTDLGLTVSEERPIDWEPFKRVLARYREARQQ